MENRAHSKGSASPASLVRFGPFELDLRAGELRKGGSRIRLQEQPFQILRILLESPGEVVLREEIRSRLWPDDTIVEFDHSINAAVNRLRDALRDSSGKPRYIETLARRGYRFIGQVEEIDRPAPVAPLIVTPVGRGAHSQAEPSASRPVPPFSRPRIVMPVLLAAIILLGLAGTWYSRRGTQPVATPLQPLVRLDVDVGSQASPVSEAVLSPDGRRLVYVSQSKLFTRLLDQPETTELAGTEDAHLPFFSPDGQWVGFFDGGKLKKTAVKGGPVIALCNATLVSGGSWGEDGNIIAALSITGLSRVPASGGDPTRVTDLGPGEIIHRWPQVLPGGRAVLFSAYTSMSGLDGATVEVLSLKDGRRKTLVRGGTWGRYLPSGHLVYISKGALLAAPFDLDRLEVRGTPMPVLDGVAYSTATGSAEIDFSGAPSGSGALVYRSSRTGGGLVTVQWLNASGNTRPLLPIPGNYLSPTLSPDESRLALTSEGDIWVYEWKRGSMMRLTFGGGHGNPLWSADGRYIVFRAARGIWWTRADGTGQPQPLIQSNHLQVPWSFTGDGTRLAFVEPDSARAAEVWTVAVESGPAGLRAGKPEVFLQAPFHERGPMLSPDGRWIAYMSNESGRNQVYVQAFPGRAGKRQVSTAPSGYPAWSRKSGELFFFQYGAHKQLMVVSYKTRGDVFLPDPPRVWSDKIAAFATTRTYDPAPDGKRIVALMAADDPAQMAQNHLVFLMNFFDELRRRVPAGRN